jgi:hypothetical protein
MISNRFSASLQAHVSLADSEIERLRQRLDRKFSAASRFSILVKPRVFDRSGSVAPVVPRRYAEADFA